MNAPLYVAVLGVCLLFVGVAGYALRRGQLGAVISTQVGGMGAVTILVAGARLHGADSQAAALIVLALLTIQAVVTCALVVGRSHDSGPSEEPSEEMLW